MTKPVSAPTASTVRAFLRDEKRFARLSPEAQASVREGARGRLHPTAVKAYNKGRKADRQYVVGAQRQAALAHRESVQARREALRAQGIPVKDRGRLPKVEAVQSKA